MWFLPSLGRPASLTKLWNAPGGMPSDMIVLCNEDDPCLPQYREVSPWAIELCPAGSRLGDIWRLVFERHPEEAFYGFMGDDHEPITPGWDKALVDAAGSTKIAYPNDQRTFPVYRTIAVVGGDLARAMGTLCPAGIKHNYQDNFLETIGRTFNIMVPLKDVIVLHHHPIFDEEMISDATYTRGSADIDEDRQRFHRWMNSNDREQMNQRVGKLLGIPTSLVDMSKQHLAILTPNGGSQMHLAYHGSLTASKAVAQSYGLRVTEVQNGNASHIGKGREHLLWKAYYETDATHFLCIDNDMDWDPKLPLHLVASGHDFCGVVGRKKVDEVAFAVNFLPNPQQFHSHTGFLEVKEFGTAFMLVTREAIDRMIEAYPDLRYNTRGGRAEYALFLDILDKTSPDDEFPDRLSEDLSFCRRWRAIGGQIYIDHEAALGHHGNTVYRGAVVSLLEFTETEQTAQAAE